MRRVEMPIALLLFVVATIALFRFPVYERMLAPGSSTASFEEGLRRVRAASHDPTRDILVLGDSRIFEGFDASVASRAAPGLHFVNAAVVGTTPRCWWIFDRRLDPAADRYRAVVIPVDTYADDDSAIGSVDGDDRVADLRLIALEAAPSEAARIAASFHTSEGRADAFFDLLLRGPLLRDDVSDFASDPVARLRALRERKDDDPHVRVGSMSGLRVDFAHERLRAPASYPLAARAELERQVLLRPQPSDSYARYRSEWIAPIVERYRSRGTPVIFVRIPTRPIHRTPIRATAAGEIARIGAQLGAILLDETRYVALERPELFLDADHLNARGARAMSTLLGDDVSAALARSAPPRAQRADGRAIAEASLLGPVLRSLAIGEPLRFTSFEFYVFFAIVVVAVFATRERRARRAILLLASYYFYARWNAWYLVVLLALTATDYAFGRLVEGADRRWKRVSLVAGVGANLAFLASAKYADFASGTIAALLGRHDDPWALHVLVPIGISFHTFQSISYLIDVSRGRMRAVRDPLDYALYLAFFPQLLAGPIVRAHQFFREWWGGRGVARFDWDGASAGAALVAIGLAKKLVVADRFAYVADTYFANPAAAPGGLAAWSATLAFAIEIYCDFSGYTDIAIGLARILGLQFPPNFARPYVAWSVSEFWRRWHMTLSHWLRDYLYIPLGGNRHGRATTVRNLLLTMLLGGLWHGANWTFVGWGAYHGALLAIERLARREGRSAIVPAGTARVIASTVTFTFVALGWILFRSPDFATAAVVFASLVSFARSQAVFGPPLAALAFLLGFLEIAAESRPRWLSRFRPLARSAAFAGLLLALEVGADPGRTPAFVYFRF